MSFQNRHDEAYLQLLWDIVYTGEDSGDRTGTGTRRLFAPSTLSFEYINEHFPLLTHKYVNPDSVFSELIWFAQGKTNERDLAELRWGTQDESKKTIWTANRDKQATALGYTDGELGPIYGHQWRNLKVDQLQDVVYQIINNPTSRRMIVDAWNVDQLDEMALPPCHMFFQFFVEDSNLDCQVYMRSWDYILGAPYNIASYAGLMHMIALYTGTTPRHLYFSSGDTHVYQNHLDEARRILELPTYAAPTLEINNRPSAGQSFSDWVNSLKTTDFRIYDYQSGPAIKLPMSA